MALADVPTALVHSRAQLLRLADAAKTIWVAYWARKAERDTVWVLQSLDDRTLKDIGIDRSEIESVVYARAQAASKERRVTLCADPHGPDHRSSTTCVGRLMHTPGCA